MLSPSLPLQPALKAPSPLIPEPALPRRPAPGAQLSPHRGRRQSPCGEDRSLTRVVHGAHAVQRGNASFQGSPDERPRRTPAQTTRRDLPSVPLEPERENRVDVGGMQRLTDGIRGGTKLSASRC